MHYSPGRRKFRKNYQKSQKEPKMDSEIEKLQQDIKNLRENSREIQNSNNPECLKTIQIRFIAKLISKAQAKIDFLQDMEKCKKVKNDL